MHMPFVLMKGTFKPKTGVPDGDSVRFRPDNRAFGSLLRQNGRPPRFNENNGTVGLRFEGIDALEKSALKQFAEAATQKNLELLGLDMSQNDPEAQAYLLANQVDPHGRVIAFVFAGETSEPDGSSVFLDATEVKKSVNYQLLAEGLVYPLFYDTMFFDLRETFSDAAVAARNAGRGLWPQDATNTGAGIAWQGKSSLATLPPIFPKLWRRLDNYTNDNDFKWASNTLGAFDDYLDEQNDRLTIKTNAHKTGFDNIVKVTGNTLRMSEKPEDLIFDH